MLLNLIITGVGGQGNVLASQILGKAAVNKGFQVTIGETFGLSQRGGAVMSHVRLSDGKSYGPVIPPNMADIIVGLEPLETLRVFPEYAKKNSTLIVNARPIYPLNVIAGDVDYPELHWIRDALDRDGNRLFWLNATQLAVELGGPIMLNMIMLGAVCELPEVPLKRVDIQQILSAVFPKSRLEGNLRALEIGGELIQNHEN